MKLTFRKLYCMNNMLTLGLQGFNELVAFIDIKHHVFTSLHNGKGIKSLVVRISYPVDTASTNSICLRRMKKVVWRGRKKKLMQEVADN